MRRLRILTAFALSLALVPATASFAQSSGRGGFAGSGGTTRTGAASVIDIDFEGGSLSGYYEHLQTQTGVRNIVFSSDQLDNATMPEVRLTRVTFSDAIELPYFLVDLPEDRGLSIDTVGSNRSIFVVNLRARDAELVRADPARRPISLNFEGGSLSAFVAAVQDAAGARRVLLRGDTEVFDMPPLKLEGVTLHAVMMAIHGDQRSTVSGGRLALTAQYRDGVYVVEVETDEPSRSAQEQARTQTVTWSLAALRGPGRLPTAQMLTAIEAAVEVGGHAETTEIRFHDETSLLIVSARPDAIQTIDGVLDQLRRSSEESARDYQRLQQRQEQLVEFESRIRVLRQSIEAMNAKKQSIAENGSPAASTQVQMLENQIVQAENEMRELTEQVTRLRTELDRPTQAP